MSKFVKLAVGVAFVLSVISVATSLMLAVKQLKYREVMERRGKQIEQNQNMQASINKKIDQFEKVVKEKKELQNQVDIIKGKLESTQEKMSNMEEQLAAKEEQIEKLSKQAQMYAGGADEAKVNELVAQVDKLQSELETAQKQLNQTETKREDIFAKIEQLTGQVEEKDAKLAEARKRESDLLTLVSMLKSQVSQLKEITSQKKESVGKVEAPIEVVNEELMFIVFDMGSKNGIRQEDVLKVFRGEEFLGLVTVIEVFPNKAAASISHKLIEKNIGKDCVVRK